MYPTSACSIWAKEKARKLFRYSDAVCDLESREYLLERMERHIASSKLEKTKQRDIRAVFLTIPLVRMDSINLQQFWPMYPNKSVFPRFFYESFYEAWRSFITWLLLGNYVVSIFRLLI